MSRPPKYPFRKMEVGETCFIPNRKTPSLKGCVSHMKPERRFKFRQVARGGVTGTRVWRVA